MRKMNMGALIAGVILMGVLQGANAQYFNFTANFSPSPVKASGGGQLTILNGSSTGGYAGSAGTNISLANILTASTAPDSSPESINQNYTIDLTLVAADAAGNPNGASVTHTFAGNLNGTLSTGSSNIANLFSAPLSQTFNLNNGPFIVTLKSYTPPGAPGSSTQGSISAHVAGPLQTNVPEPGTLSMLLSSGMGGALLLFRRRRA